MKNHWLYLTGQKKTIKEINQLLKKFIGYSINPIDELFLDMRNEILIYFKKNPDKLKFFTDGIESFDYNFEVEEKKDIVTGVIFTLDPF